MLDFLRFSSGIASIGRFPPFFFLWSFPAIQRGEQCPNHWDLESYVFPTFHLQCKGALTRKRRVPKRPAVVRAFVLRGGLSAPTGRPAPSIFNFFYSKNNSRASLFLYVDILWFILKVDIRAGDDESISCFDASTHQTKYSTWFAIYVSQSLNKGRNNLLHKIYHGTRSIWTPCMGIQVVRMTFKLCWSLYLSLSSGGAGWVINFLLANLLEYLIEECILVFLVSSFSCPLSEVSFAKKKVRFPRC